MHNDEKFPKNDDDFNLDKSCCLTINYKNQTCILCSLANNTKLKKNKNSFN